VFTLKTLNSEFKEAIRLYNSSPSTHFSGATPNETMKSGYNTDLLKHQLNTKMKYAKIKKQKQYHKEVSHS